MRSVVWKVIAEVPALVGSAALMLVVIGLLPPWAAALVLGAGPVWAIWSLTARRERGVARLVLGARPPTAVELTGLAHPITVLCGQQMGPPAIDVMVVDRPGWPAHGFGRRTLLVTRDMITCSRRGQLSRDETTALMVAGVGALRTAVPRFDAPLAVLTLPVLPLRVVAAVVAATLGRIPLVAFAWRIRFLTVGIAAWQMADSGLPIALSVVAVVVGLLSYLVPVARNRVWRTLLLAGDDFASAAGHAPALLRLLRRFPDDEFLTGRAHRLAPPVPHLSVVR